MRILEKNEWDSLHRESRQSFNDYLLVINDALDTLRICTENLENEAWKNTFTKAKIMRAARARAWESNDLIFYSYSGGAAVSELAEFFPKIIKNWEDFAYHDLAFDNSPESDGHRVPHIYLYDSDYWFALQLVSFAILLGHPELLKRIMDLLVYENDDQDALLDAMVAPWLPERKESTIYTRQLPYRKTKKIFAADSQKRPALMGQYLDEWYAASRRELYYDRHKSSHFPGYWSLEAGVITFILDIDDWSYREKPFYPRDLVDYARKNAPKPRLLSLDGIT